MELFDTLIIGGGCAGLSAGMYAARMNLKTALFAELPGGLITTTHIVENWPGIKSISGPDLGMQLWEHAKVSGVVMKSERIISVAADGGASGAAAGDGAGGAAGAFVVKSSRNEYRGKTLIFATGSVHRHLDVPGEKELQNRGVSYCALCDGAFFKNKEVCVVGGGDSAAKEALFLAEHAAKVYVVVRRDVLRAEPINHQLIAQNPKIEVMYKQEIAEIFGNSSVEGVKLKSGTTLPLQGVFVAIGQLPATELAIGLGVAVNERNEIIINRRSETNVPGVYSCGDCTDTEFKQAITGAAEGVSAAYYAFARVTKSRIG